jgi:hypothetical protein
MDAMVATPANAGLLPGWSAQMQGMMSLIRVLPPAEYDRMTATVRNRSGDDTRQAPTDDNQKQPHPAMPDMPGMHQPKGGSR